VLLQPCDLRLQGRDTGGQLRRRCSEGVAEFAEDAFVVPDLLLGRLAGPHLDAANARADTAVAGYQRDADLTASFDVRPTAEFPSPVAEGDDANTVAIFLVEE